MFRTRLSHLLGVTLSVCALLCISTTARAQTPGLNDTEFQVERFEPLPSQGTNILNTAKSETLPHLAPSFGLFMHYVDDPIQLVEDVNGDTTVQSRIIGSQFKGELWGAVGFFDVVDLGFVLPIVLYQDGDSLEVFGSDDALETATLADLRVVPKVQLINPDWAGGFGAAILGTVFLPMGDTQLNSDGEIRVEPRLALDWSHDIGLAIAGNVAYAIRPERAAQNFVSDDVVRWSAGIETPTGIENLQLIGTVFGDVQLAENRDPANISVDVDDGRGQPAEWLAGVQYSFPANIVANAGAGTGLTRGVGSPDFRIFASVGYTPRERDSDDDGILDADDACPDDPEDKDGFEDSDGCPDTDNDNDGIPDLEDACPMEAEDADTFEDEDGCPDVDNDQDGVLDEDDECPMDAGVVAKKGCPEFDRDGDGILDENDKCPDEAEDKDGFEDTDGCPDNDNDQDGIFDADDKCPNEAEDKDGFEDEDGCPDRDNDQDGVLDADDKCPNEKETINGNEDEDGCPDKGKSKVRVTKEKIEILEKVYFDSGKSTIKPISFNILNQVAQVLRANPQITKILIEGHTDSRGSDSMNMQLSKDRAKAVLEFLKAAGVEEGRLQSEGYGEEKPIATNDTRSGREQNRRVEFTITEVNGKPVGDGPVTIEKKEVIEEGDDSSATDE
jgi:outer membrane protein OmpA-like peptidoglycan-associated protein